MSGEHETNTAAAPRAVVLLSGGLDSATTLALARAEGWACHCLCFAYGQRHRPELEAAERVAASLGAAELRVMPIDLRLFGGSALTDDIDVPRHRSDGEIAGGIPVTYVPGRNLIFLSLASAYAETVGARCMYIGVNAIDYSGYPDCRPEFIESFQRTVNLATKAGVEGRSIAVRAPLIGMSKAAIIGKGAELGVDYALTLSCYDPDAEGRACGRCDACLLRARGFRDAGVPDPTVYAEREGDTASQR